jgi:hypothetical protein
MYVNLHTSATLENVIRRQRERTTKRELRLRLAMVLCYLSLSLLLYSNRVFFFFDRDSYFPWGLWVFIYRDFFGMTLRRECWDQALNPKKMGLIVTCKSEQRKRRSLWFRFFFAFVNFVL